MADDGAFSLNLVAGPSAPPRPAEAAPASSRPQSQTRRSDDHNKGARGRGGRAQGSRPGRGDERGATPRTSGSSHPNKGLNGTASQHDKGQGRRVGKTVVSSLFTGGDEGPLGEPAPRAGSGGPPHVRRTRNPAVFSGTHFRDLDLTDRLVRQLEERIGVTKLTPAQQLAAPFLMVGRDVLLKSPTGTGKTLAYAVPIVQDLQGLQHRVQRSDGPLAVIITPTRELAQQSLAVMQSLLAAFAWIVPGAITGGEKKKSEKARFRKGINVLVATPGRLRDHIEHTRSLDLKSIRWLVLDEADRLMDAGFERDVQYIVQAVDSARAATNKARRRTNVLVSATLTPDVRRLAKTILHTPTFLDTTAPTDEGRITTFEKEEAAEAAAEAPSEHNEMRSAAEDMEDDGESDDTEESAASSGDREDKSHALHDDPEDNKTVPGSASENSVAALAPTHAPGTTFTTSENLEQYYAIVPCKLRLMALVAFLKGHCQGARGVKAIVFLQSRNEVAFYQKLLLAAAEQTTALPEQDDDEPALATQLGPMPLFFLHGGMEQRDRTAAYQGFCHTTSGALVCTDVAARGLDLPAVSWILQMSAPSSAAEYVHRVGRTARLEASGKALLLLLPLEEPFVDILQEHDLRLEARDVMSILGTMVERRRALDPGAVRFTATRLQLGFERLLLSRDALAQAGRDAFVAFVRAYATYPSDMKKIFHIKNLHLGHLAKSFALRETPQAIHGAGMPKGIKAGGKSTAKRSAHSTSSRDEPRRKKFTPAQRMREGARRVMASANSEFGGLEASSSSAARSRRRRAAADEDA